MKAHRGSIRNPPFRHRRDLRVGGAPYGMGQTRPNHYAAMLKVAWHNRRSLPFAWRILRRGVCDGCALGVAGLHDWTMHGVHLCMTRLELLETNTMGAVDERALRDVDGLRTMSGKQLRGLGRLAHPMVRRRGDRGFTRVGWDDALDLLADRVRDAGPDRIAFYLTARGITNEAYYVAQKVARFLGTNNIDNAARVCHAPSTLALKQMIGVGATTVSYTDVINSDLVVLFGSHVANAQPVFMKYLLLARKRGCRVAVVNPLREPGLERYWVPSNVESALFGTKMTDEFFTIHTGGDVAFLNGVLKVLLARDAIDKAFVTEHTAGFDGVLESLEHQSLDDLERLSGASRADMERFADMYASARSAVLVWSMGITQHEHGVENVNAIVDLALARGNVGRPGAGLMPIRGHSGVQGGAEMGCYSSVFPGGIPIDETSAADLEEAYGFHVPSTPGLTAPEMLDAAARGELDVLWSSGGNFLDVLPDPERVRAVLEATPVRVHQDVVVSSQMLVDPGEIVVLLPAATRYEQPGGGTSTTTERRIAFSPEIEGRRVGEARAEWEIFLDLARRADPERAAGLGCHDADAIRKEIATVVPLYRGIESLADTGDQVQWGGERLCEGGVFSTADGRARFVAVEPRDADVPAGRYRLSTRRGKQFNSMVFEDHDPLTGADRDAVFMSSADAADLGLEEGAAVVVRSSHGEMRGRVHLAPIQPGNVQAHWPEANVLIGAGRDERSGVPDYNAIVELEPASA